jgi:hypothetical protein
MLSLMAPGFQLDQLLKINWPQVFQGVLQKELQHLDVPCLRSGV